MSKWGSIRLVGSYAHQALQAKIAFEIAERDGHFRRTLARERKAAFRGELDREEAKRLYSKAAMDQRCELRRRSHASRGISGPYGARATARLVPVARATTRTAWYELQVQRSITVESDRDPIVGPWTGLFRQSASQENTDV